MRLIVKNIEFIIKKLLPKKYLFKKRILREIKKKKEPEISLIKDLIEPETDSIDIGVYRGVHSYEMSKYSKIIHSFEPNPVIYKDLKKTLPLIIDNLKLYNYALSDKNITKNLRIPIRNLKANKLNYEEFYEMGKATIHEENKFENYENFKVECKILDDFKFNNSISFIKIDVEGHEISVLNGAKIIIKKFKPNLLIEIEERHSKRNVKDTINFVCSFGYNSYVFKENKLINTNLVINLNDHNNFIFKEIK
tara:strand:- start:266 stop:1018 length:753 start_codon:yes stop_codon:yes gene_type:complete